MIVCEEHKLLYLAPPKTGSISVLTMIDGQPPFNGYRQDETQAHHNTVWDERFRDWYIFITVRHPYTRMISLWQFALSQMNTVKHGLPQNEYSHWWYNLLKSRELSLYRFLTHRKIRSLLRGVWSCHWHLEVIQRPVDKLVRQERFNVEIKQVPGLENMPDRHANRGYPLDREWHEYYGHRTLELVRDLWVNDFEPLGYNSNITEVIQGKYFV
jgi:hypothetical protein